MSPPEDTFLESCCYFTGTNFSPRLTGLLLSTKVPTP
jgi:hypothetical protein